MAETTDDPTESGFFQTLETGEKAAADRMILRMAWLRCKSIQPCTIMDAVALW